MIEMISGPRPELRRAVIAGLVGYNSQHVGPEGWESVEFYALDDREGLCGGLIGHTHWGWLFINQLWVHEQQRQRGIGRRLLVAAEALARSRGCGGAWLDTFDFQSRGFYEKLGFSVFATLEGFPAGHERYFLRKVLI
jgi:GNAT superfamily N-acetyltransferase